MSKLPYYRPNSLLEIGCNTGPNLYRAAKLFPKAKLTGIDINEDAIESGRVFFKQLGMNNVNLIIGKADNLSSFGSKSFDIVLSEALLIYIGKDKIEKVIQEMIRVARRAIIVLEYHDDESTALGDYMFDSSYWKRNYDALFRNQKAVKDVKITRITREMWDDDRWVKFGAIIEARLANEDE
ncbi:MAG: class I SAM-dependent methyltransferase [Thermoplasmata archaeon]|nr:class I SAM-dependent methyltransferase [Thermoplasmata archaeon]